MSDQRAAFLKALEVNEDDIQTRLVYADWLDEHGEHEEADRQRRWQAAKQWIVDLCSPYSANGDQYEEGETVIDYERLVEMAFEAVESLDDGDDRNACMRFGSAEGLMYAFSEQRDEFWKNWSIVTGIPLPESISRVGYRCAC